jgi:hypothetical protein
MTNITSSVKLPVTNSLHKTASLTPRQTAVQRDEEHRKAVEDGLNNPVSWYHWNKEVPLMDSKAAWQDDQYQAWRNAQVQKSGSYRDGRFTGVAPASSSYPVTSSADALRSVNQVPQTQLPHMPNDNWAAR